VSDNDISDGRKFMQYNMLQMWAEFFIYTRSDFFAESMRSIETNKSNKRIIENNIRNDINSIYKGLTNGNITSTGRESRDYPGFLYHGQRSFKYEEYKKYGNNEKNYTYQFIHATPEVIRVKPLLMEIIGYDANYPDFFECHIGEKKEGLICPACKKNQCDVVIEEDDDYQGRRRVSLSAQCKCGAIMSEQTIRNWMNEVFERKCNSNMGKSVEVTHRDIRNYFEKK
jgi:hypothetical protein